MGLGLVPLLLGWFWPLSFWQRTALNWYGIAIAALIAVFLPGIGLKLNGAHRWLHVGGIIIQPVEFVKFALLIFFASWMSKHQRLGAFLLFLGIPAGLLLLQPDLGSLLVVVGIALGMYVLAEGDLKKLLPIAGIGLLGLVGVIIVSPYRWAHITTYFNPESDPLGAGFHMRQVTLALGNGGWWGRGLGNSTQKYLYIPEASSDSVFAIVAEEVGFIGSTVIIGMFGAFILLLLTLVQRAPTGSFGRLVGHGIFLWLSGQVILNLAAIVALVPLTGIPLPFFSYGGSSLLMLFFIMGLVLQISDSGRRTSDSTS
jgi:cell division protein FtsW